MSEVRAALDRVVSALPGGGEPRPGQAAMAEAVAAAIEGGRHLVVQAGTGTGKSLAYLVPAVLSDQKIVVATATKALQDQLAHKDLPFLGAHLGTEFDFAVLKGRSNYLCRQRVSEIGAGDEQMELGGADDDVSPLGRQVLRLVEWAGTSETGDRAELDFEPRSLAWSQVSVTSRECPGAPNCPKGDECFAEAARQRAADADVVVVNTALYAMHLASGGWLLPEHDVVVFDEAHAVEDVMADAFGLELTAGRLAALGRTTRGVAGDVPEVSALEAAAAALTAALGPHLGARVDPADDEGLSLTLARCREAVDLATGALRRAQAQADGGKRTRAVKAAGSLAEDLAAALDVAEHEVAWVEGADDAPVLRVAPVDVASLLSERLWSDEGPATAILTSATIAPALPLRLGLPASTYEHIDVGSPFDFAHEAVLYCARRLPDPRRPEHQEAMHEELEALIRAAGGRTLALFTSWRAMRAAAGALREPLPWRLLTQDELPKPALVAAFAGDETSCLFATMGFWQGVDVPGPSLSLVVIDRIPFPRPDEPLLQARRERAGPGAFGLVDLPRAATLLAQGAGRLIRSRTDRGVVAVLDPRLATAGYRAELLRAMPPMRLTGLRANVEEFLSPRS